MTRSGRAGILSARHRHSGRTGATRGRRSRHGGDLEARRHLRVTRVSIRSRVALALLGVFVLVIMAVTLTPADARTAAAFSCLICGERGLADVILNVIMFMPIGALAVLAFGASPAILAAAAFFSAGVEAAQYFIPGRDASAGDLLFNTTGALVGIGLAVSAPFWVRPGRIGRYTVVSALGMVCITIAAGTGFFVRPVFTDYTWYAQHTPDLPHLRHYEGTVIAADVGGVPLRGTSRMSRGLRDSLRTRLESGEETTVELVAGPPPPGLAAFVTIYDELRREMLLLGAIGDDLAMRVRIVSEDLRLDKPYPRLRGVLAPFEPGDTLRVAGRLDDGAYCLTIEGETTCGIGMDVSRGWQLLYSAESLPAWFRTLVSLGWMAGLAGLLGFYARDGVSSTIGITAAAIAFLGVPAMDRFLQATPLPMLLAACVAYAGAAALGRLAERRFSRPPAATPADAA